MISQVLILQQRIIYIKILLAYIYYNKSIVFDFVLLYIVRVDYDIINISVLLCWCLLFVDYIFVACIIEY